MAEVEVDRFLAELIGDKQPVDTDLSKLHCICCHSSYILVESVHKSKRITSNVISRIYIFTMIKIITKRMRNSKCTVTCVM